MATKSSLGGDAVRLTVSKLLALCITMVSGMLLSRFRTLDEYGTYSQLLLVVSVFSSAFMLGLPSCANYFLGRAETSEEKQKFLSVYYSLSTILSIIMGASLVCAAPLLVKYFNNPTLTNFIYFLAVYPWTSTINSSVENVLIAYKKTHYMLTFRLSHSLCVLGSILFIQVLSLGFKEYMLVYLAVECVFSIIVFRIVNRVGGKISISFDWPWVKQIMLFSIPIGIGSIVGTLDIEMDKLLIGRLMTTDQMAIYSNASKELPATIIAASISAVLLPEFARLLKNNEHREAIKVWNTASELSFIFMALIVSGLVTYADAVIELLYSEKYLPGLPVFRVYSITLLLRVTYFGIMLNAEGKTKEILYCSIVALFLNLLLNPLLFWVLGMVGPAIATLISVMAVNLLQLVLTSKYAKVGIHEVFPWKACAHILAINAGCATVFYFIKLWLPLNTLIGNVGESIMLGLIWSVLYVLIMRRQIQHLWNKLTGA